MNGLFCLFATQGTKSETRLPVRSPSHCLFRAGPGRTTPGMQAVFQAQVRCGRQRPGRVTQGAVAADRFPDALHLGLEHRRVDGLDPPGTPRRRGGLLVSGRTIGVSSFFAEKRTDTNSPLDTNNPLPCSVRRMKARH